MIYWEYNLIPKRAAMPMHLNFEKETRPKPSKVGNNRDENNRNYVQ